MDPTADTRPAVLMLLTRDPYVERSGRAAMLRQRIEQVSQAYRPVIVVIGRGEAGPLARLPMAGPVSLALNAVRLAGRPLQSWLCYTAAVRRQVAQLAAKEQVVAVYVDMLRLAPLAEGLPKAIPRILDYDDLLSTRYRLAAEARAGGYQVMGFMSGKAPLLSRAANLFSRTLLGAEGRRCEAEELRLLASADLALFTSAREAQTLAARGAGLPRTPPVLGAPPVVRPAAAAKDAAPGERILFLGNLRYGENELMLDDLARAAQALASQGAWPGGTIIDVVGDHAPEFARRYDPARFRFLGRVEDLTTLAGAGVFVAPVASGSGVKLKVLDGMSLGCPVVTTPKGCEGLQARADRDLLVCADATGVLRTALALRGKPRLKAMLAARGRAYLERWHSDAMTETLLAAIAKVLA